MWLKYLTMSPKQKNHKTKKMKIETDLRLAIKSAEKAQPAESWEERNKAERKAIEDLIKKPRVSLAVKRLVRTIQKSSKKLDECRSLLCKGFGLRIRDTSTGELEFANCDGNRTAFVKAGGKVPVKNVRWRYDNVMAQLAAASDKEGRAILKKLGINWE